MKWTEEMDAALRRMHAEGMAFSAIAAAIGGMSRNAAIGRATRLGLPGRGGPGHGGRVARPTMSVRLRDGRRAENGGGIPQVIKNRIRARAKRPEPERDVEEDGAEVDGINDLPPDSSPCAVPLLQLCGHHCRWPLGDPAGDATLFCGAQKARGAYCARHGAMAYSGKTWRPDVGPDGQPRRRTGFHFGKER